MPLGGEEKGLTINLVLNAFRDPVSPGMGDKAGWERQ